jgi:hypothetical protein
MIVFGTIRRHQKWLWAILIVIVIISFVIWFSPDAALRISGGKVNLGSINGKEITVAEYRQARNEADIRHLLYYGEWPKNRSRQDDMQDRETRTRLLISEIIKQEALYPSEEAVANWIRSLAVFRDKRTGAFVPQAYTEFITNILARENKSEADFARLAENEVCLQVLGAVYGLPGKLITPKEAEFAFIRENETLQAEVAIFNYSNFLAQVAPENHELITFYSNNIAMYRIPERVQVSYVKFEATNYYSEAEAQISKETNLNQRINALYESRGKEFFTDENGKQLSETEAKNKIRNEYKERLALIAARRAAAEFASEVFNLTPVKPENLATVASKRGLTIKDTKPFSLADGPTEINVPDTFAKAAFKLTAEEPFSQPIIADDGVYVFTLKARLPSEIPTFEQIKDKVVQDYKRSRAIQIARQTAEKFTTLLSTNNTQSFEALCKMLNVSHLQIEFTMRSEKIADLEPAIDVSLLKETIFKLGEGKLSRVTFYRDGAFVTKLNKRIPVSEETIKRELPGYLARLRQSAQYAAFEEWFSKRVADLKMTVPDQQK